MSSRSSVRSATVERCLALVLRLVRRSLGEVGSFSEGGCEADSVGNGEFTAELDVHCLGRLFAPALASHAIHAFREAAVFKETFC
jgi:hypothetical protein